MSRTFLARRTVLCVVLACMALAICSAAAFAAVRTGTEEADKLVGTNEADQISGMGGDDITVGRGGDDAYSYADGWGKDSLRDSGGTDTLNFSAVTTGVWVILCPEVPQAGEADLGGQAYENGVNSTINRVDFASQIENARGGADDDILYGCSGANKLAGGGGDDGLADLGGYDLPNMTDLPRSDDRYSGFQRGSGNDVVVDAGGRADVLDMRAFGSGGVELFRFDFAATPFGGSKPDGVADSLLIKTGANSGVGVANFFAPNDYFAHFNGRVEKILLRDKTISPQDAPPLPEPTTQQIAARNSMAQTEGTSTGHGLVFDLSD